MNRAKRMAAILLTAILFLSLPGCRSGAPSSGGPSSGSVSVPANPDPSAGTDTPAEPDLESAQLPAPTEVRLLLTYDAALGSTEEGRDRVGQELAAMAETAAGLPVIVTWVEQREAAAFLAAAVEAGEVFDLYMGGGDAAKAEARGLFQPVKASLIEENAPEFFSLMEPWIRPLWEDRGPDNAPVEHSLSLFPLYKPVSEALYMDFRADLCEAAGYTKEDVAAMTDWNQVYLLLKAAQKAAGEGFVGLAGTQKNDRSGSGLIGPDVICCGGKFSDAIVYDNLGDTTNLIATTGGTNPGYMFRTGRDLQSQLPPEERVGNDVAGYSLCLWAGDSRGAVSSNPDVAFYYSQSVLNVQDRLNAWYLEGLIWPESGTKTYPGNPSEIFARIYRASELAPEEPDRYRVKITNTMVTAADAVRGYFAIPASARATGEALRILNMIYAGDTAGEWANLMVYGLRDVDYVVEEDGRLAATAGETSYRNAELGCNPLFLGEWVTEETGTRLRQTLALEAMHRSPYYGCTVDTTDLEELVRTLRQIANEHIPNLTWGAVGATRTSWGSLRGSAENGVFSKALLEAGIETYVQYYQARLNAWLSES